MSSIGFIVNGVRHCSFIDPTWFPDGGMTMWIFVTSMTRSDMEQFAWRLKEVEWIPDQGHITLRRPLDTLRAIMEGSCTQLPDHPWRVWDGPSRWAYFVDIDNGEYEIWRYGMANASTGRLRLEDLSWESFCADRQRLLDLELKNCSVPLEPISELTPQQLHEQHELVETDLSIALDRMQVS